MLPKYFREAYRIRQEEKDYNAWLQGVYIYKALDSALYNNPPFQKRGREARNYYEEPLTQRNIKIQTEEEEAKMRELEEAKMAVWLENFVSMYKK